MRCYGQSESSLNKAAKATELGWCMQEDFLEEAVFQLGLKTGSGDRPSGGEGRPGCSTCASGVQMVAAGGGGWSDWIGDPEGTEMSH